MPGSLRRISVVDGRIADLRMLAGFADDLVADNATRLVNCIRGVLVMSHPSLERARALYLDKTVGSAVLAKLCGSVGLSTTVWRSLHALISKQAPSSHQEILHRITTALAEQSVIILGSWFVNQMLKVLATQLLSDSGTRSDLERSSKRRSDLTSWADPDVNARYRGQGRNPRSASKSLTSVTAVLFVGHNGVEVCAPRSGGAYKTADSVVVKNAWNRHTSTGGVVPVSFCGRRSGMYWTINRPSTWWAFFCEVNAVNGISATEIHRCVSSSSWVGPGNSGIVTLVERNTRFVLIERLPGVLDSVAVIDVIRSQIICLPEHLRKPPTWNQGRGSRWTAPIGRTVGVRAKTTTSMP